MINLIKSLFCNIREFVFFLTFQFVNFDRFISNIISYHQNKRNNSWEYVRCERWDCSASIQAVIIFGKTVKECYLFHYSVPKRNWTKFYRCELVFMSWKFQCRFVDTLNKKKIYQNDDDENDDDDDNNNNNNSNRSQQFALMI